MSSEPADVHRERLESILANAVDAIITTDENGIVRSANPATEKLFGYPLDEVIGQNVKMLMPLPFSVEHDQYLKNYAATGIKKIIGIGREVVGQRQDGTTFQVHLAVSEIQVEGRKVFTGVVRDISDVKTVEAKLVQNARLAAIGQMVAGLAHESRNAFQRSHACLANLAFDVKEMPESLDLVHKVQESLDHVNSLLDEVRDYSAPIILKKSPTNVEKLIRDTWDQILTASPDSNSVAFEIEQDTEFPDDLKLDRRRFGQVFWNLLENARVACQANSNPYILVQLLVGKQRDNSIKRFCIQLSDSGKGIDPENLENVFEPFFTTKTKGTGLGLAICRRIVDAHNGRITVSNNAQGGARFRIQVNVE